MRDIRTIDKEAISGLSHKEAHEVLSWLESHVLLMQFDDDTDFIPSRDGTAIGDLVLNIRKGKA